MRILLVDDEPLIRELLARICAQEGHEASQAGTAGEALALLRSGPFDLLLTDIVMPELDGLALIRRARAIQPDVMCIVITGHTHEYKLEHVLDAGASDLILKPFRAPELRARLRLADEQRRTLSRLRAQERAIHDTSSAAIAGLQRELDAARQMVARLSAVVTRGEEPV